MKKLSLGATLAWQIAAQEAAASRHQFIEPEHLLIGICSLEKILTRSEDADLAPQMRDNIKSEYDAVENCLHGFDLDSTQLRREVRRGLGKGESEQKEKIIHRSQTSKEIFNRAQEITTVEEVTSVHLFAVLLEGPSKVISSVLDELKIHPDKLRTCTLVNANQLHPPEDAKGSLEVHPGEHKLVQGGLHYLDRYGRDLTQAARDGKLGPFIGRRQELLQIIQTLARRSKNNPVLVGEAGVGKTAIVEALAVRIAEGKDSQVLGGKRIVELNMGALVGGTKYRGEFEERLTGLLEEVRTQPEVILFIDEIHNLVGAGRGDGSMDAANLIKPALSRGDMKCIGATTILEYRRYIEGDPALERRFEKIIINEPTSEETLEILKGLRGKWEEHHQVHITDQALQAAVDLSIRFDADHQLPDKAIDLVDKAGAHTRVPLLSKWVGKKVKDDDKAFEEVTETTVAQVLSEKIGVPLEVITGHLDGVKKSRLLELETFLKTRIIGQDDAVQRVCQRLLMAQSGLAARRGPLAVFLFLGPSGVGKTEMARSLAMFLFGSESDMIQLDMSEYMEEYCVSKMIGSPPGYVGHEEEGQFTSQLRTKPYSVVLLDEIEKAHPKVFDLFLQVFDDGRLTDSKGRTADARNAIFIMTSNISTTKHAGMGFMPSVQVTDDVLQEVAKRFRPEFINRINDQIIFRALVEEDVRKIIKPILAEICQNLHKQYQVTLQVDEKAEIILAQMGFSPQYGVRELHRTVEKYIQIPLSELILSGKLVKKSHWQLIRKGEGLVFIQTTQVESRKRKK